MPPLSVQLLRQAALLYGRVMVGHRSDWKARPFAWLGRLSLAWQFVLAAVLVLLVGMGLIGFWVTARIEEAVTRNAAVSTALYVDSVIAPLTRELASSDALGEGARLALRETLGEGVLGGRMFAFKIWKPDGTVIFSNEAEVVGRRFEMTEGLAAAATGRVHGEFNQLGEQENATERRAGIPLLEIYSPIREPWSGRVIAVSEFYEAAGELADDLARARLRSWLVVGGVTLAMLALLFGIVARGSRMIARQRQALGAKVTELSRMLEQNRALRLRAEQAGQRTAAINERYLRRLSAELHDGPAQLLAFASLRMSSLRGPHASEHDENVVRQALGEAMNEIRNICRGLMLPEIEALSTADILRRAVDSHRGRTGRTVELALDEPLPDLSHAQKICTYRFVQEALNNAARHAGDACVRVVAQRHGEELSVTVSDDGRGFDLQVPHRGLGLVGMEERIVSLGGSFSIGSVRGRGTEVTMRLETGRLDTGRMN